MRPDSGLAGQAGSRPVPSNHVSSAAVRRCTDVTFRFYGPDAPEFGWGVGVITLLG